MRSSLVICALLYLAVGSHALFAEDKVVWLPTAEGHSFDIEMYSGYLEISGGKRIFYIFTPSQGNPHSDPLVLWMNGGPGASSLYGAFFENGPLVFYNAGDQHLTKNPQAWNRRANVLYFESPAGVGFSIPGSPDQVTHMND